MSQSNQVAVSATAPGLSFDAATMMRYDANKKTSTITYLLWFFLGGFGAHRFYLGRIVSGLVILAIWMLSLLLTVVYIGLAGFAALALWLIVDAFLIPGMVRAYNNSLITRISSGGPV